MICKEDVYMWFSNLSAPKRLDFMCGFLPMFHPLELRFIGSCLEDLAKKDYNSLREHENKANDSAEVEKCVLLSDEDMRSKISVYLALLHSSNTVCSSILFKAFMCIPTLLQQASYQNLPLDSNLINDIIIILTMAAYHPSFTFHQRQILFEHLHAVQSLFEEQSSKDCCTSSSSPSAEVDSSCQHVDPICASSPSVSNGSKDHNSSSNSCSNSSSGVSSTGPNTSKSMMYIESLEVKGCQVRPSDKKSEFIIQVTWSNGQVTETCKTYQQLHNFHSELIKLFPKDSGAHKQKRQIPFLPQEKGPSHDHREMEDHIRKYIRSSTNDTITTSSASVVAAMATTRVPASPLTITVESRSPGTQTGRIIPTAFPNNNPATSYSCHTYSSLQTSPSPLSSPLPSPLSSPYVSPSTSSSSRPASPGPCCDITKWLKDMRLHKYTEKLSKYSIDEFLALSDMDLEADGLTAGARRKFRNKIGQFGKRVSANGMVCMDGGSVRSSTPPSPAAWHTPPSTVSYLPPTAVNQAKLHLAAGSASNMSSLDSSPACSEYSSPPNSPAPYHQHMLDSASSEENEKVDQQEPEVLEAGNGESSEGLLPTPNMAPLPTAGGVLPDHIPVATRLGCVMGLPPGVKIENQVMNAFMPIPSQLDMKGGANDVLPHHYPISGGGGGVRSMLPPGVAMPPMYFSHSQRIRSPRQQAPQQNIQLKPLAPSTTATTSPVMPSPKMPANTATIIYENGHQVAANHPYPLVPNHTHGQPVTHPHVPHLCVPQGPPPPKAVSQYGLPPEVPNTCPGMTATCTDTVTSFKGHMGYVPAPIMTNHGTPVNSVGGGLARPSSLNTLASTSLTYSMAQGHPMHQGPVPLDSSLKATPVHQPTAPPPQPQQVPPQSGGPPPSHTVSVSSNDYTTYQGTNTAGYNSPPPTPVLHLNSPTPTPIPAPGHSPVPQPQTVPPSSTASCSSCGCLGNCLNATPTAPTNPLPPPYPYSNYHVLQWHQNLFPFLPGNSNGLISPSVPFPPMHPQMPNGLSSDVLYSNHPNFLMQAAGTGPAPHPGHPYMAAFTGSANLAHNHANTTKKATCHNCGRSGHRGPECKEPTMEALTHSGNYHLKLRPSSQEME